LIYGLLIKSGIYDTSPLRDYLTKIIGTNLARDRPVIIGTTDANSGTNVFINLTTLNDQDAIQAVMCSSAIPTLFPHQLFKGETYIDDCINLNLISAIN